MTMANSTSDEDFGFSFVDESEIEERVQTAEGSFKERLAEIERLLLPLLNNLTKDPEKVMIKWPNRVEVVQKYRDKLLKLTRD